MRFFLVILTILSCSASAQKLEFTQPVKLGIEVNSEAEELGPILSSDGKTLYFSRVLHPENTGGKLGGLDIWMSTKDDKGKWRKASNEANGWNNQLNNAVIGVSKDNLVVYLNNAYNKQSGISFSKNLRRVWTTPELIPVPGLKISDFVGFYMNKNFDVLLISMHAKNSYGEEDLYISFKDSLNKWSDPVNLGQTINSTGYEISPFLSDDGTRIYFSSNGHLGYGDADVFYSDRLYGSWTVWSKPVNLGRPINSEKYDAYFSIQDDSVVFFSSNREGELADVYQSKIFIRPKTVIQDSVNRIVQQTKQLLSELKEIEGTDKNEIIPIEMIGGKTLSLKSKEQLDSKLSAYLTTDLLSNIEIIGYLNSNPDREVQKTLSDQLGRVREYLISKGVNNNKVVQQVVPNVDSKPDKPTRIDVRFLYRSKQ